MTFLPIEPGEEMKGKYLPPSLSCSLQGALCLSPPEEGQESGGLPNSQGSALRGLKVTIHPPSVSFL